MLIGLFACSSEPKTVRYELKQFTRKTISSKKKYEDNFKLSGLNDSIKLQLPFSIDTSFIVSEYCGNAPRCKKFIAKDKNIKVEICQQAYEQIAIPKTNNKEHNEQQKLKYEEQIRRDKQIIYGYNVNHNLISFETAKTEYWKISGIEIISEKENNTIKVNCLNKKTKEHSNSWETSLFQLDWYTTISIELLKTEMKTNDVLESIQFICETIEI